MAIRNYKGQFVKGISPWNKGTKGVMPTSFWKGKKLSKEHRKKLSEAKIGKISPMKGKKHTIESREKMSKSLKGKKPWIEGKKHTIESREKMSQNALNGWSNGRIHWNQDKGKGWIDEKGYKWRCINGKTIRDHRYVWTKYNQMPVPKGYVIHHINCDKTDNYMENLILLDRSTHSSLHRAIEKGIMNIN